MSHFILILEKQREGEIHEEKEAHPEEEEGERKDGVRKERMEENQNYNHSYPVIYYFAVIKKNPVLEFKLGFCLHPLAFISP
jgi:hypothetical protein